MAVPVLSTVTRTQGNNRALKDGVVRPRGFELRFEEVPVLVQAFRRMVRGLEFDVSEMALTTYLCARAHGVAFTALPVFLVRGFHHGAISYRTDRGITGPADLAGRRVGVNRGYTVTTGVWVRGILQDEYGLDPSSVTWVLSGDEHVADYRPPPNVVAKPDDRSLEELLVAGEVDAVIGVDVEHPDVAPLLPDAEEAGYRSLVERGTYPINHLVVVKDSVLVEHPDAAVAAFEAFAESKRRYVDRLRAGDVEAPDATDRMYARVLQLTGDDPLPYGIEPNRAVLERLVDHAVAQRILTERVPVESVFAESTLGLTG